MGVLESEILRHVEVGCVCVHGGLGPWGLRGIEGFRVRAGSLSAWTSSWALECHTLINFLLEGSIMKCKYTLFSPWLLKRPGKD